MMSEIATSGQLLLRSTLSGRGLDGFFGDTKAYLAFVFYTKWSKYDQTTERFQLIMLHYWSGVLYRPLNKLWANKPNNMSKMPEHKGDWSVSGNNMSIKWVIVDPGNNVSPLWHQTVIRANANSLSIGPGVTNFIEILFKIKYSLKINVFENVLYKCGILCQDLDMLSELNYRRNAASGSSIKKYYK